MGGLGGQCSITSATHAATFATNIWGWTFPLNIPSVDCQASSSFALYLELSILLELEVTLYPDKIGVYIHVLQSHIELGGEVTSFFKI